MYDYSKLLKNAIPVSNIEITNYIKNLQDSIDLNEILTSQEIKNEFLNNYLSWLKKSKLINYSGLDDFNHKSFSHGTIQSFDFFYSKHSKKRFRFFKGEFIYHKLSCRNNYNFKFIEDEDLDRNDAVIISLPFSDNGGLHPNFYDILNKCEKVNIPVLIDLAYINISNKLDINLNYSCIETLTFSLSKAFTSVERLRIGMRLNRKFEDDPMDVFNSINMVNNFGAYIGNKLINEFGPDYNFNKFNEKQNLICKKYNLTKSNCIIFGLGDDRYIDYNRGGLYNRVCISKLLAEN